jgi:hypothetical protein
MYVKIGLVASFRRELVSRLFSNQKGERFRATLFSCGPLVNSREMKNRALSIPVSVHFSDLLDLIPRFCSERKEGKGWAAVLPLRSNTVLRVLRASMMHIFR